MSKIVITFDDKEVEEIKMIVTDDDKEEALEFIKENLYRKINDSTRQRVCGPKL